MILEYGYAPMKINGSNDPFCPLCARPPEIYPVRIEDPRNPYWITVEDILAETLYRKETLLLVLTEHEEAIVGDSYKSACYLHLMKDRVHSYQIAKYKKIHSFWFHYEGRGFDTVDTVPEHYYEGVIITDGTGDVRQPAAKSPTRLLEISLRADAFDVRYYKGEIPNRFQAAS